VRRDAALKTLCIKRSALWKSRRDAKREAEAVALKLG
jgi:hypothetical protein